MGRTPAAIPDRLSMMTELPDLDDFHDDAIRLAVLLLGLRGEPTEGEVLLIAQALRPSDKGAGSRTRSGVRHRRL